MAGAPCTAALHFLRRAALGAAKLERDQPVAVNGGVGIGVVLPQPLPHHQARLAMCVLALANKPHVRRKSHVGDNFSPDEMKRVLRSPDVLAAATDAIFAGAAVVFRRSGPVNHTDVGVVVKLPTSRGTGVSAPRPTGANARRRANGSRHQVRRVAATLHPRRNLCRVEFYPSAGSIPTLMSTGPRTVGGSGSNEPRSLMFGPFSIATRSSREAGGTNMSRWTLIVAGSRNAG